MQKQVCLMVASLVMTFCITVLVSSFALHDHRYRKMLVGSVGLVASVGMYASPLVAVVSSISSTNISRSRASKSQFLIEGKINN